MAKVFLHARYQTGRERNFDAIEATISPQITRLVARLTA